MRFYNTLLIFFVIIASPALAKQDEPRSTVADLRYGVALYHYYQAEYMEALTELLVAKERGGIQGHGDNPEIMEGGFSLAYGLEKHAGEIFDRLLAENRSVEARDAAWFFIAKLRYQKADWDAADDAISHISKKPKKRIREELVVLKIHQAIKQGRLDEAESLLKDNKIAPAWLPYVMFNMGSAWAREGQYDAAIKYYSSLGKREYRKNEHIALYDKAMTAAGYAYLFNKQPELAIEQFSRVRRDSKHSTRALLGYGWAAADMEDYKTALKPWAFLAKSSLIDENSQESLVAVPYAYEKLGAENLALENFKVAESKFIEEIFTLEEVIENLQGEAILEALKIEKSEGLDWLLFAKDNKLAPQLSYLIKLFSTEAFQSSVQELRDLLATQAMLHDWREKLVFYADMLDEREFSRLTKNEYVAQTELKNKILEMQTARADLARRIERISAEKDYFALTSEDQQDLVERIERADRTIDALRASDPFIDEYEESARRYRGLLLWDASESFSIRMWRAVKTLNVLDEALGNTKKNHRSVLDILGNAPDMNGYRRRIAQANKKLVEQIAITDSAVERSKNGLRDQVAGVLVAQRHRLNHYLSQSRLSIARIYDKARYEYLQKDAAEAAEKSAEARANAELPDDAQTEGDAQTGADAQVEGNTDESLNDPAQPSEAQNEPSGEPAQ